MAWDTTIAPAPMLITARTEPSVDSSPRERSRGDIRAEVATMVVVVEPWAVFRAAAMTKGTKIPRLRPLAALPRYAATDVALMIAPKAPPAPVMRIMGPAVLIPSPIHFIITSSSNFGARLRAQRKPMKRAIKGLPRNKSTFETSPSSEARSGTVATAPRPIRRMGTTIGAKDIGAEGSVP